MDESQKKAQQRYEKTEAGKIRQAKYNQSEKGRARKRKYTYLLSPEQQAKQREAKRLSAQRRREKLREKNFNLPS